MRAVKEWSLADLQTATFFMSLLAVKGNVELQLHQKLANFFSAAPNVTTYDSTTKHVYSNTFARQPQSVPLKVLQVTLSQPVVNLPQSHRRRPTSTCSNPFGEVTNVQLRHGTRARR